MFIIFTDETFKCFETLCNTLTGLWYGQEGFGYPALFILLEYCTINFCAVDFSKKAISVQLKGYTLTDSQFHVGEILQHGHSHNLLILHYTPLP
jgi:hypothetical protein